MISPLVFYIYTGRQIRKYSQSEISFLQKKFAIGVLWQHIFYPLFGVQGRIARVFSVLIRMIHFLLLLTGFGISAIPLFLFVLTWYLLPLITGYALFIQFA